MQTSNPFSVPFPYYLSEALARAYARAQEANPGAAPSPSDIFAAFARGHTPPGSPAAPAAAGASDSADPSATCGRVDRAELLAVMREPIAWVFTLAERGAQGDQIDLAAIDRVRGAILHRVDAIISGAVASEPPRIRTADLLTLAGLLVGTLDPALVRHAVQALSGGFIEAIGALWPLVVDGGRRRGRARLCPGSCASEPGATRALRLHPADQRAVREPVRGAARCAVRRAVRRTAHAAPAGAALVQAARRFPLLTSEQLS